MNKNSHQTEFFSILLDIDLSSQVFFLFAPLKFEYRLLMIILYRCFQGLHVYLNKNLWYFALLDRKTDEGNVFAIMPRNISELWRNEKETFSEIKHMLNHYLYFIKYSFLSDRFQTCAFFSAFNTAEHFNRIRCTTMIWIDPIFSF